MKIKEKIEELDTICFLLQIIGLAAILIVMSEHANSQYVGVSALIGICGFAAIVRACLIEETSDYYAIIRVAGVAGFGIIILTFTGYL